MGKECPECGESFSDEAEVCPYDATTLEERGTDADELIGHVVDDRFRLERLLGKGGMGRVYEATQLSVERRVAVKLIRYRGTPDRSVRERFVREARVVSELSHPNIVRLIDFGRDEERGAPYIAMEYIDGLEVHRLVEDHRLQPSLALEIASQVAAALVEAHEAEIVHRDLKTDNVLLVPVSSGGFQAKVIDFGIAFPRSSTDRLTNTGMICGTPRYVSPEQARGGDVGPRSDLYSLGVVIFEMVTGVLPFEADSAFNVMMKHVQKPPPSIRGVLEEDQLPEGLTELVDDLLRKDADRRPASAREVRDRIAEIRDANDWEPIDLDGVDELKEELQPWLEPPARETSGPPRRARDGDYEVVDADEAAFSAPDFSSASGGDTPTPHHRATTDPGAPTLGDDEPPNGEPAAPDVVGVPGQTGAPLGPDGAADGDERSADDEPSPAGTDGRIRTWWRAATAGTGLLALAGVVGYWVGPATISANSSEFDREARSADEVRSSAESTGGTEPEAASAHGREPAVGERERDAAGATHATTSRDAGVPAARRESPPSEPADPPDRPPSADPSERVETASGESADSPERPDGPAEPGAPEETDKQKKGEAGTWASDEAIEDELDRTESE